MQASRPLTSGTADAVSTGSSYGRGYFPPVERATVTSDSMVSRKRLPLAEQDGSREGEEEDDKGDEEEPAERRTAAARHAPKRGPHDASSGRDQRGVRKAELAMLRASDQP